MLPITQVEPGERLSRIYGRASLECYGVELGQRVGAEARCFHNAFAVRILRTEERWLLHRLGPASDRGTCGTVGGQREEDAIPAERKAVKTIWRDPVNKHVHSDAGLQLGPQRSVDGN